MEVEEILRRLDSYISWAITYYARKSYKSYWVGTPSYMLGRFEAVYQVAYALIEEYTIQDVIDAIHDDIAYYDEVLRNDNLRSLMRSYYKGLVRGYKRTIVFLDRLKYEYESATDYPIKHVWSVVGFENIADAINSY